MAVGRCADCRYWGRNGYEEGWGACDHPRIDGYWVRSESDGRADDQIAEAVAYFDDATWRGIDRERDQPTEGHEDDPPPDWFLGFQTRPDFGCVMFETKDGD